MTGRIAVNAIERDYNTMEARINKETWLEFRERNAVIERHHRDEVLRRCLEEERWTE